jgi:hypothetical protein
VSFDRAAEQEHGELAGAGAAGFTLRGTGTAAVTTPPLYRRHATYVVRMSGASGPITTTVVAGRDGRLRLSVPMGLPVPMPPAVIGEPDLVPLPATDVTISRRAA